MLCSKIVDVLDPVLMIFQAVRGQPDYFHISLFEFVLETRDFGEFGSADGGEVSRMGEQDCLVFALVDFALIREGQRVPTNRQSTHEI